MKQQKKLIEFLPAAVGINYLFIIIALIFIVLAFTMKGNTTFEPYISLFAGLGASLFIAGLLGLFNLLIISKEIGKVTNEPFEILSTSLKIINSGITNIFRTRSGAIDIMIDDIQKERAEIVIVGSSLKGLIGVGKSCTLGEQNIRNLLIQALQRNVNISLLLTDPVVADHRRRQEGRRDGDIEFEIMQNLILFVELVATYDKKLNGSINIKLYNGTPTIFMIATSQRMLINPYTYYQAAFNSFTFLINSNTDLFKFYYKSHYQEAWQDSDLTESLGDINNNPLQALEKLEKKIDCKNPHSPNDCILDEKKRELLKKYLNEAKGEITRIYDEKKSV